MRIRQGHVWLASATMLVSSIGLAAQRQGPGPGGGPGSTQAMPDLAAAQRQAVDDGVRTFGKQYTMAEGLGPVFNDESCTDCHRAGGDSTRTVTCDRSDAAQG